MDSRRYDAGREKSYPDLVKAFFHRQKVRTLVRNDIDEQVKTHLINLPNTPTEGGCFTQIPTVRDRNVTPFVMPLSYDALPLTPDACTSTVSDIGLSLNSLQHDKHAHREGENSQTISHGLHLIVTHLEAKNIERSRV